MNEATYQRADELAQRAIKITNSLEKLGFQPDEITVSTVERGAVESEDVHHHVKIYVEDAQLPTDVVCRIHQILLDDLYKIKR